MRPFLLALVLLAVCLGLASGVCADTSPLLYADGFALTAAQWRVVARIYEYADFYGLRDEDRDLLLHVAYRETGFGLDRQGDYDPMLNRYLSIGVFQWREGGVWLSTPCYPEYGYAGRWNMDEVFAGLASGTMGGLPMFPSSLRRLFARMFQEPLKTYLPGVFADISARGLDDAIAA